MKKKICFLMVIVFLLAYSVPAMAYDKDDVQTVLITIKSNVEQTNAILDSLYDIIKWQIEGSKQNIEDYKTAVANGQTYENPVQQEEVQAKVDELSSFIDQVQELKSETDELALMKIEPVDRTIEAAKTYFFWIDAALNDLKDIYDFEFANEDAMKPLEEFDYEAGEDLAYIEALYAVIQDVVANMEAVDCPEYMEAKYKNYIRQLNIICTILETTYYAIDRTDVLRSYSVIQLMGRMEIQIMQHEIALVEQFNLQFEKVQTRLEGRVTTLNNELIANCDLLINALGGR
ncbi:MAG: hypothetical protein ACYCX2_06580 [Christensenellales bacterium]